MRNGNATAPRRILVVDDEPMVRQTLIMALECERHHVQAVASAEEALAIFAPEKFDLVITDLSMPGMPGDQLAATLKRLAPSQPIVMLTAHAEEVQSPKNSLRAIDCLLAKPFPLARLHEVIAGFAPIQAGAAPDGEAGRYLIAHSPPPDTLSGDHGAPGFQTAKNTNSTPTN